MNTSKSSKLDWPTPERAWHSNGQIHILLSDGREVSFSCAENEYLEEASEQERSVIELSAMGVHWPLLDEDLSIEGILAGRYGRKFRHGGARSGAGRPLSQRKPVTLRLSPEARRQLEENARRSGQTLSETAEQAILQHN